MPRAGTQYRAKIAAMFGARRGEGYSLADLELATVGAWEDEWRRSNGHTGHESVLRPTKVQKLIDAGRAARAGRDWTAFDE